MDTSSSLPAPVFETVQSQTLIECPNCHIKHTFQALGAERSSPVEAGLVEGLLLCPECGHESHCYFMSQNLRAERAKIFGTIKILAKRRTPVNFQRVKELKEKYKNLFDIEQSKYQAILSDKKVPESQDG